MFLFLTFLLCVIEFSSSCEHKVTVLAEVNGAIETTMYDSFDSLKVHTDNTEVVLCSYLEIVLHESLSFQNVSNLSIQGNNSSINCHNDTGLTFYNISNLLISDFTVKNCKVSSHIDIEEKRNVNAGIVVINSWNINIVHVVILKSPGSGLAIFNADGELNITECVFKENGYDQTTGGNGLYIEISEDIPQLQFPLVYNLLRNNFTNNRAYTGKETNIYGFSRFDKGGGLCIFVRSQNKVTITIENSFFTGNRVASYGGGVFIAFHNDVSNSSVSVHGSTYFNNSAKFGGGHYIDYVHNSIKGQVPFKCSNIFKLNNFTENNAEYGGGVSVFSTGVKESEFVGNVNFENCTWEHNSAQFGSAIAILPNAWTLNIGGFLPKIHFDNCTMRFNYVKDKIIDEFNTDTLQKQFSSGFGGLFCSKHVISFRNFNRFYSNNGSSLSTMSCTLTFVRHSETHFFNNSGFNGGAMYLKSSILNLTDNVVIKFENNSVRGRGGALFFTANSYHAYNYSWTCFFSHQGMVNKSSINIQFINNKAESTFGHSIYASSLLPCARIYHKNLFETVTFALLDEIGNFQFQPNRTCEITTAPRKSVFSEPNRPVYLIPGKQQVLPFTDKDDLNQNTTSVYVAVLAKSNSASIDEAYIFVNNNTIKLYGNTSNEDWLTLSSFASQRQQYLSLKFKFAACPPGYVLNGSRECVCAFESHYEYMGIKYCDKISWRAYRIRGYWVGYKKDEIEHDNSLFTGKCPNGFCFHNGSLLLPATAEYELVNSAVCSSTRTGVLCGECKENNSAYFHNLHYECKASENCNFGWVWYILSELVPVTIIFTVIIILNLTFTSGKVNGFIFYSQVVVLLHVTAGDSIPFPQEIKSMISILQFLYYNFNLNTFVLDKMSFCLFKNANALDVIAFNYITLGYALFLIIGVIFITNKLSVRCSCKPMKNHFKPEWVSLEGSIIHGLTAFLVLSYGKCMQTTLSLLMFARIYSQGKLHKKYVVYYNGEIGLFAKEHLRYAIPATIVLIFQILLPITLFVYPLHYKIISFLKLPNVRCIRLACNPLEKLKPLFDSFQGSFKDDFRFFAGLYFVYRCLFHLNIIFSSFEEIYFFFSIQLLFMFLLHAVCQPYKSKAHNIVDTLLFFNLAAINKITLHNFSSTKAEVKSVYNSVTAFGVIQIILLSLPLVVVISIMLTKVARIVIKTYFVKNNKAHNTPTDEDEIIMERLDDTLYKSFSDGD